MSQNHPRTLYSYRLESAAAVPVGTKFLLIIFSTEFGQDHDYDTKEPYSTSRKNREIYAFASEEELQEQIKQLASKRDYDSNKLLIVEVGNFLRIVTDIQVGFITK